MSDNPILDSLESTHGIKEIRKRRRILLCKILSLIGAAFLFVFGVVSYFNQLFWLSAILLSSMLIGLANIYLLIKSQDEERAVILLSIILIVLSITLLTTGGKDNTGILWIYPIVAINLFINRFWQAVIVSVLFLLFSSLLLFSPLSELLLTSYPVGTALRFELTVAALCAMCLTAIHAEEQSYNTAVEIFNNDIHRLAYYDTLTGLPNRVSFLKSLDALIAAADKEMYTISLLYIDLDNFKRINDSFGHQVGDELLAAFSKKLTGVLTSLSNKAITARLAGDEFVVVLPDTPLKEVHHITENLLAIFDGGFEVNGVVHPVYASIGIAEYPDNSESSAELLHHADAAMYEAKKQEKHTFRTFSEELANELAERNAIEQGLRSALKAGQFSLVYMPVFNCRTLDLVGVEVLVRCHNPTLEGIGPDRFIPVAETTGLIKEIDLWVMDEAFGTLRNLIDNHDYQGLYCLNISGIELHDEQFPDTVKTLIQKYQLNPKTIELEVTETALVLDDRKGIAILNRLREQGISISLDDFGTGYTAFSQLIHYPASTLKIDRSFISNLFSGHKEKDKMVPIFQTLASLYGLKVVAEGVETEEQLQYLQHTGCDWVQGYHLSKPLTLNALVEILKSTIVRQNHKQ